MNLSALDRIRFYSKYREADGCWMWDGHKDPHGYGRFKAKGKHLRAHRVAYFLRTDVDPGGLCVCHTCDVPGCVNPSHLFLGTIGDNNADRARKGRSAYPFWAIGADRSGEKNGRAKLKLSDVVYIRTSHLKNAELARIFNVSTQLVSDIRLRKKWV